MFLDDVYLRVEELVGEELQGAGEDDPVKKKSYIFILSVYAPEYQFVYNTNVLVVNIYMYLIFHF